MGDIRQLRKNYRTLFARYCVDADSKSGFNIITNRPRFPSGAQSDLSFRQQAFKGRYPARRGRSQSSPREGARSKISQQRLLRSVRCCAGEIRNVAARFHRQAFNHGSFRRIWRFQANLLPSQGKFRDRWNCRTGPVETRSSWPPQARRRRAYISTDASGAWSADPRSGTGKAYSPRSRHRHPPQIHRTGIKKNSVVNFAAPSAGSSTAILCRAIGWFIDSHSETVRNAAWQRAWRGATARGAQRSHRVFAPRHVGLGQGATRTSKPLSRRNNTNLFANSHRAVPQQPERRHPHSRCNCHGHQ